MDQQMNLITLSFLCDLKGIVLTQRAKNDPTCNRSRDSNFSEQASTLHTSIKKRKRKEK